MKLLRIGEVGSEVPVVLGRNGEMLRLPSPLGDIDAAFWAGGVDREVQRLLVAGELTDVVTEPVRIGAPIAKPEKIVCIGLNYRDHARETNSPIPTEPIIFMKAPNCIVGPTDEVLVPRTSQKMDWEIELGVVIGSRVRYLESPDDAPGVIAGYCLSDDVSERAFQLERGGQWVKGKSCETFNPLGPWVVTKDEIADPQELSLQLSVNGVLRQNGTTRDMIFGVNYLVWYVSQFMVLEPGDLVNTGTPAGVSMGDESVAFLKAGDILELSVPELGTQRNVLAQA
jgi:2-keto-4-pentenoate hydratase/2-oxohepta-3-ene-1,7-dioic acid hydratase in catechol pathway